MPTSLLAITKRMMRAYGIDVVMNRAVPDFRDGLKPVQRRALWALNDEGAVARGSFFKVARISGTTLKYHPHGSQNISDTIVNMVNASKPLIKGQGNFGSYNDPPAADRYIECKMTELSEKLMLRSDYLHAVPMVSNYDGREREPLYLPSLFPNLLLNGVQGIAYGVTGNIPPIHPDTVMPLIHDCLSGKKITTEDIFKNLRFNWPNPCTCVSEDADIMAWLGNGRGPLYFQPPFEIDEKKKMITFLSVPPQFNFESVVESLEQKDWVISVSDLLDKNSKSSALIEVKIRTKRGGSADDSDEDDGSTSSNSASDFEEKVQTVVMRFTNTFAASTAVVSRNLKEMSFQRRTIPEFIHEWCTYRVGLERDLQTHRISEFQKEIATYDLLALVVKNLEKVTPIIKESETPKEALMALLNISKDEATSVLAFTLSRLTRLNQNEIIAKKKKAQANQRQAESWKAKPISKIQTDLNSYLPLINAG